MVLEAFLYTNLNVEPIWFQFRTKLFYLFHRLNRLLNELLGVPRPVCSRVWCFVVCRPTSPKQASYIPGALRVLSLSCAEARQEEGQGKIDIILSSIKEGSVSAGTRV